MYFGKYVATFRWTCRLPCWRWEQNVPLQFMNQYKHSRCHILVDHSLDTAWRPQIFVSFYHHSGLSNYCSWNDVHKCFRIKQLWTGFMTRLVCVKVQLKCDGTRWRTGGEVKWKLANGVGSQYPSHYLGTWCIQHYYRWCAHLGCQQSTELTPLPI